jgi:hypothetical protein
LLPDRQTILTLGKDSLGFQRRLCSFGLTLMHNVVVGARNRA